MKRIHLTLLTLLTFGMPFAALAQEPSLVNSNGTQIDTDAERAAFRAAVQAQPSSRTFYDRFDDSSYYANGATITHAVSLPRVGAAWRLAVAADQIAPAVTIPPVVATSFQGAAADDSLTIAAGHGLLTTFPVRVSGAGLPAPLVADTTYYAIRISSTVVKLATNSANARAGTVINLTTDGSAAQSIRAFGMARGLTPSDGNGLFYLSSSVPSVNGRMTLGFEFTPVRTDQPGGALDLGLNISFHNAEMVPNSTGIAPEGVAHLNINSSGIPSADFYGGSGNIPFVCTSHTYATTEYPWNSRGSRWVTGRKQLIIFDVEGDYLRVICPGHGSIEFYHPDISTRIGPTTRFWWEPSGTSGPGGNSYQRKAVLHRVTDSLEQIQTEQWGNEEMSGLGVANQANVQTRLRVVGDPAVPWLAGNEPTASDDYFVATPGMIRADRGFRERRWAGYADYRVQLVASLVSTEILSTSGDNYLVNRLSLQDFPLDTAGQFTEWEVNGSFAANGNSKGVQILNASSGGILVETGPITPSGGTWSFRGRRVFLNGSRNHEFQGQIMVHSGGTTTFYTGRLEDNFPLGLVMALQVRLRSPTAAGDVRIQQGVVRM